MTWVNWRLLFSFPPTHILPSLSSLALKHSLSLSPLSEIVKYCFGRFHSSSSYKWSSPLRKRHIALFMGWKRGYHPSCAPVARRKWGDEVRLDCQYGHREGWVLASCVCWRLSSLAPCYVNMMKDIQHVNVIFAFLTIFAWFCVDLSDEAHSKLAANIDPNHYTLP